MHILLLATMLSLPLYPLNPVQQDTLSFMSLHITGGVDGPNGILSAGPELSAKYEMLFYHPLILRAAFDYRFGKVNSVLYPQGDLRAGTFSAEVLYYRGTKRMTGYIGGGIVFARHSFDMREHAADSLVRSEGITNVEVSNVVGYRITTGLRFRHNFSLEISMTDIRPDFLYITRTSSDRYTLVRKQVRFNDFRVSFGYLFTLKM